MTSPDPERDAKHMDEVHSAVNSGEAIVPLLAPWGIEEAKRILGLVQDEYINDFNRAMRQRPHELDVRTFTTKYDALWRARLDLDRAEYAAAYRARFGDGPIG